MLRIPDNRKLSVGEPDRYFGENGESAMVALKERGDIMDPVDRITFAPSEHEGRLFSSRWMGRRGRKDCDAYLLEASSMHVQLVPLPELA